MTLATANRTALYRVKEVNWGTTPLTPALKELRYTGEALDDAISTEKSKEIRSDRMVTDLILVDASPSGSINHELSYGAFDDEFEAAMMSTWSVAADIASIDVDVSFVATATDNLTSTLATKFDTLQVGQVIKVSGAVNPALNTFYTITAKTSGQLLTVVPQPAAAETSAAGNITFGGSSFIRNGVLEQSFTYIKQFNDTTIMTRQVFKGMRVKGFSMDMQTASILNMVFNYVGKTADFTESVIAGESFVPATTADVMNCVTNVVNLLQDGVVMGAVGSIMSLQLELDNQHREQKGIGVLGNVGVAAGTLMVTANASQYFESKEQADKFKQSEAFSFSFRLEDPTGAAYVFTLPRCKYASFVVNSSQQDSDVMAETTFEALRDPATNCMIQIDRFAPAP